MLGKILKIHRESGGLTQKNLAEKLGYASPQFISDWEREYSQPPMKKIIELGKLLKISDQELLKWLIEDAKNRLEQDLRKSYQAEKTRRR